MFQQYQGGIQPVSGYIETGANIGNMFAKGLTDLGKGVSEGVEAYNKNKALNDSADQKLATMADEFALRIQQFSSTPEYAPFAERYKPLQKQVEKAHTFNLAKKLALLHEIDALNSKTDKDFVLFDVLKKSKEAQVTPDAVRAGNVGTERTIPLASNPRDTKYNPYETFDQNEQSARKYYRDLRKAAPDVAMKDEDSWIAEWRNSIPKLLQADTTLHPAVRARAMEQVDNALADIDAGPDSNINYYLSRYSDVPVETKTGPSAPPVVTQATPSLANPVPTNASGTPIPSYGNFFNVNPTKQIDDEIAALNAEVDKEKNRTNLMGRSLTNPATISKLQTRIFQLNSIKGRILSEQASRPSGQPALPTPPSAQANPTAQPAPAPASLPVPQSVEKAASPVLPTPVPVLPAPESARQPAPAVIPPVPAPVSATQPAQAAPVIPVPVANAPVAAPATPALPPPPSASEKPKAKPVKKEEKPKETRLVGSNQTTGEMAKWYKGDQFLTFAARNKVQIRDVAEANGLPLNATPAEISAVAEKNGGQLMLPFKRNKDGTVNYDTASDGPTGDMGMEGETGEEGQPEEGPAATTVGQRNMGRDIFVEDSQKKSIEYQGARAAREYLQMLQNNVENGTASGLPTGWFNQAVKQNPDLWRSLGFGTSTALKAVGTGRAISGVGRALQASKDFQNLPNPTQQSIQRELTAEMNKLVGQIKGGDKLDVSDPKIKKAWQQAVDNVGNRQGAPYANALKGMGNALKGSGWAVASSLVNDEISDKFDLPPEIARTGPAWSSEFGGKFVNKTLDEIREIATGNYSPAQKARINQLLLRKVKEAQDNETRLDQEFKQHWSKASPQAFSASYAGAALPDAQRTSSLPDGYSAFKQGDQYGEQPSLSVPSLPMGTKTIIKPPNIDEKRTQMANFFKERLGYVPSSFDSIVKNAYPEASLTFQETPYGVMMHDGKEWKPLSSGKTLQPSEISANRAVTFGSMGANGDFQGEELVPNSGIRIGGIGAFGSPSDATKFRNEYPRLIRAKNALLKLQEINGQFGKSLDLTLRGKAAILTKEIIAQLRTEIVGVGTVSNFEQGILQDIVQNPADIFHWTSTTGAKYAQLLEQVQESLKSMPAQYGLSVDMREDRVKELQAAREYWRQSQKK